MRKPFAIAALFVFALTLNLAAADSAQPVQPTSTPEPTLAKKVRAGKPPADIDAITVNFDKLVAELGEAETVAGVQAANGMTDDEMDTLLGWMDGVRQAARAEKQAAQTPESEKVRKHHITCSRALRPCWREFEKAEGGPGAVEP